MGSATAAGQAPRRRRNCTLPMDSARVRGSAPTSRSAGRASKSVMPACGSTRAACSASASPTGPAPTTAICHAVFVTSVSFAAAYYLPRPAGGARGGSGHGGTLAWRYPMAGNEIQHGGSLTVRESQVALFVDEGRVADVFGPGRYRLTTQTLPVLTYLKHWDKLFQSPFKSDVYFFSMRQQLDRRWGTTQPVTIRDPDFGAVRLRAFGNYAYRIGDAQRFHTEVSGTRERYTVEDLDGQLRGLMLQHISDAVAQSGVPFLDLAANQVAFASQLHSAAAAEFARLGLVLERM